MGRGSSGRVDGRAPSLLRPLPVGSGSRVAGAAGSCEPGSRVRFPCLARASCGRGPGSASSRVRAPPRPWGRLPGRGRRRSAVGRRAGWRWRPPGPAVPHSGPRPSSEPARVWPGRLPATRGSPASLRLRIPGFPPAGLPALRRRLAPGAGLSRPLSLVRRSWSVAVACVRARARVVVPLRGAVRLWVCSVVLRGLAFLGVCVWGWLCACLCAWGRVFVRGRVFVWARVWVFGCVSLWRVALVGCPASGAGVSRGLVGGPGGGACVRVGGAGRVVSLACSFSPCARPFIPSPRPRARRPPAPPRPFGSCARRRSHAQAQRCELRGGRSSHPRGPRPRCTGACRGGPAAGRGERGQDKPAARPRGASDGYVRSVRSRVPFGG